MLLNLSNHPSSFWPEDQLSEAIRLFGEVKDLKHPVIDPSAGTVEVLLLVEQSFVAIKAINPVAVHVMGEHSFCHALVARLQRAGYKVYCSTTKRDAEQISDTQIRRTFSFVRFREYAPI
ncbi:MAG: hypothetical protein LAT84_13905 [Balneolia bacterium]|nr:hypothetical protein [Balneolia bacterium]